MVLTLTFELRRVYHKLADISWMDNVSYQVASPFSVLVRLATREQTLLSPFCLGALAYVVHFDVITEAQKHHQSF